MDKLIFDIQKSKQMDTTIKELAGMLKAQYEAFIEAGFSEHQAFSFVCETYSVILKNSLGGAE